MRGQEYSAAISHVSIVCDPRANEKLTPQPIRSPDEFDPPPLG